MGFGLWVLRDGEPVEEPDALAWGRWMQTADRIVARTHFGDGSYVSTVFLGCDHDFSGAGPPVLWETMVFGPGTEDEEMDRYSSREAALAGHDAIVAARIRRKAPDLSRLFEGMEAPP